MSGVAGLLVAIGLRMARQISADIRTWSDIPDRLFICLGAVCLFWAGYAAWADKDRMLVSLQERLRSPEFSGNINFLSVCPTGSRDQDTFVIVTGIIANQFGPPSAVLDWSMKLVFADTRIIQGTVPLWNGKDIHLATAPPNKQEVTLDAKGYWPHAAGENPIPPGGIKPGWFWSDFKDITREKIVEANPRLVIEFTDAIARKTHQIVVPTSRFNQPLFGLDDVHNR